MALTAEVPDPSRYSGSSQRDQLSLRLGWELGMRTQMGALGRRSEIGPASSNWNAYDVW